MNSSAIDEIMKASRFSMPIVNTIVDMKDYKKPIQYTLDDTLFWDLMPGTRKKTDVFIRQNDASFEDAYFQLGFPNEKQFYQVVDLDHRFEEESTYGDILSIYYRFDKTTDVYERKIYSLGELLGQAGGFFSALIGIGSLLLAIFSERLFVASVLRKIYQIDTWQEREKLDKNQRQKHRDHAAEEVIYKPDGRKLKRPYTESEKFHAGTMEEIKKFTHGGEKEIHEKDQKEILEKCEKSMRERKVFKYGYSDILHYIFCCVP